MNDTEFAFMVFLWTFLVYVCFCLNEITTNSFMFTIINYA